MTGEMSRSEVTREAFPLHFAIADAFKGATVEPFDQYQGPYVRVPGHGRIWLCVEGDCEVVVYSEKHDRKSYAFDPYWPEAPDLASSYAQEIVA